jgi:hypothetical protein
VSSRSLKLLQLVVRKTSRVLPKGATGTVQLSICQLCNVWLANSCFTNVRVYRLLNYECDVNAKLNS